MRMVFGDMVDVELVGWTLEFLVDQICIVYALRVLTSFVMKLWVCLWEQFSLKASLDHEEGIKPAQMFLWDTCR